MTTTLDKPRLLLVDFENVPRIDLTRLDESYRVIIFVGMSQKSVPLELVTATQKLGGRVEWQKVSGEGRNALDFFIAWHLGRVFEHQPRPECVVLSMDKGFDPLLKHLNAGGMLCRRVNSIQELGHVTPHKAEPPKLAPFKVAPSPDDPALRRVMEVLGRSAKRSRPRKRKTLAQAISAMFQKKLAREDIDRIIDSLLAKRLIVEAHGIFTYEF
ncbi:MAG: PIN domain-containing protein [bacterium]